MAGSPADAVSKAVERSKQLLFPFKAEKWFSLGLTVFLAQCGEGGGGGSFPNLNLPGGGPSGSSGSGTPPDFQHAIETALRALRDNLTLYLLIALGVLLLGVGLWLVVAWFSSRAKLMFVEAVIWDRVDLSAQWARAAELGLSLFKFRVGLGLASWLVLLLALGAGGLVGFADFSAGAFAGAQAIVAYLILGGALLLVGVPVAITLALLDDFVIPLMVVRNARVLDAWRLCRAEVLAGNLSGVVVFYLLRFVLGLGIAIAIVTLTCLTCCLAAIPYLGTVMLLPVWVFSRSYPLYYLEQLGIPVFPAPEPSWAAYDQWRFPR